MTLHGIAQDNAVFAVPKGDSVKENSRRLLLVHLLPVLAAVHGAVNARLAFFRRSGADDHTRVGVKRVNASEIELVRSGNRVDRPVLPTISRADDCPIRAAGPNDFIADHAQAAKARRSGNLYLLRT